MLNVDEHKDDIKDCKEQCDINYEDGVQEIKNARNPTKKIKAVYMTCNQTFAIKNEFKKNISRKSTLSSGKIMVAKC